VKARRQADAAKQSFQKWPSGFGKNAAKTEESEQAFVWRPTKLYIGLLEAIRPARFVRTSSLHIGHVPQCFTIVGIHEGAAS
jgi:hypothetical protein